MKYFSLSSNLSLSTKPTTKSTANPKRHLGRERRLTLNERFWKSLYVSFLYVRTSQSPRKLEGSGFLAHTRPYQCQLWPFSRRNFFKTRNPPSAFSPKFHLLYIAVKLSTLSTVFRTTLLSALTESRSPLKINFPLLPKIGQNAHN